MFHYSEIVLSKKVKNRTYNKLKLIFKMFKVFPFCHGLYVSQLVPFLHTQTPGALPPSVVPLA